MWIQKLPGGVQHLAYAPDGQTLYTLDTIGSVAAWHVLSRTARQFWNTNWVATAFPRGLYLLADGQLVIRTDRFFILNPATGGVRTQPAPAGLRHHDYAQVCPNGRVYYLAPTRRAVTGWNLETNVVEPGFAVSDSARVIAAVQNFELSPDRRSVVVVFLDGGPVVLFRLTEENELRDLVPVTAVRRVYKAKFSPDAQTLVIFANYPDRVTLWDVLSRTVRVPNVGSCKSSVPFAFHPTAPVFAALNKEEVLTLFSLDTGEPIRSLDFVLGKRVTCVAFAPDGLTCAVGGSNKQFAVFDVDV
jgi:WD40 repeat protein